jgi:hypothetical protein
LTAGFARSWAVDGLASGIDRGLRPLLRGWPRKNAAVRRLLLTLLACLPLLTACGERQEAVRDVFAVKAPRGAERTLFRDAGMTLERPGNWKLRRRAAPGVFELLSGQAVVAGWAYPRTEPLPESAAQLESAKNRLVGAIEERDPRYRVREARVTEVAGAPAIAVLGRQVISRRRLRTRSVHVFAGSVEYVIEAIAPPRSFARADRGVLRPLLASLELEGEVRGARR